MGGTEDSGRGANEDGRMLERQLLHLIEQVLPATEARNIQPEARLGRHRADFVVDLAGKPAIIEVKAVTPRTSLRNEQVVEQLHRYSDKYVEAAPEKPRPKLILAVPGEVTKAQHAYFARHEIDVWDGAYLRKLGEGAGLTPSDLRGLQTGTSRPDDAPATGASSPASELDSRLTTVTSGRVEWSLYQTLCGDILAYLFCPPLQQPLRESANASRVNRRDIVLPNYADNGFWHFMRMEYRAHYVVVDAKNYTRGVKKAEVLQLANYLSAHGAGLFGLILTRRAAERSAELTRREQWIMHQKMILVLNDDDLRQMLALKEAGSQPEDIIRQQIEDFRLAF